METSHIPALYLLLLLLQFLHILEEIGLEAYQGHGSLSQYLKVAGALAVVNATPLFLMLLGLRIGYTLGFLGALLGIGNGIVHGVGYVKTRSMRGTLGAGVLSSVPLGLMGIVVFCQLWSSVVR